MLWSLSIGEWLVGHWEKALALGAEAYELNKQCHEVHGGIVGRVKALVEADLGFVERARASAQEGLAAALAMADEYFAISSLGVLGRLELALGNLETAGGYLRDLPGRFIALGINDPASPVWADAIETLIGLDEREQARAYLEHYEVHANRLQSPWAIAAASRSRGLLTAANGDLPGALNALERALADLEGFNYPFERGRALLCLGSVRRQAQQKGPARTALERALAIFEELGARLWADKARAELRRISGRRPAVEALTETEHQVAGCAAQGLSNKEIASSLHMGVSTVEAHLSSVYRKLGVRRVELAQRLKSLQD
jgi:DNA-binding CsgD family transcriptional regulator